MIVASVHDPSMFAAQHLHDAVYRALVKEHLRQMAHCHVVVCDDGNLLGKELLRLRDTLPPQIRQCFEAAFCSARVIHAPCDQGKLSELCNLLDGTPATAAALALAELPQVDAVLTYDDESRADAAQALELVRANTQAADRVYSLAQYSDSAVRNREAKSAGSPSLKGMTADSFRREIIAPVVRWAREVTLVDKCLGDAVARENPRSRNRSAWSRFKRTIRLIHQSWCDECQVERVAFSILTTPARKDSAIAPHEVARILFDDLAISDLRIRVLDDSGNEMRKLTHDRYLVTSLPIVLNFSRGFDLVDTDHTLLECAVSIYREQRDCLTVSRLCSAAPLCTWPKSA